MEIPAIVEDVMHIYVNQGGDHSLVHMMYSTVVDV